VIEKTLTDHRIPKRKSLHASNKDIADLAEKGLPSVRDLVNKFIPYRTGSVNLHRSPEPQPRHSLAKKIQSTEETNFSDDNASHDHSIDSLETMNVVTLVEHQPLAVVRTR
jgi:hypothetical protein